MDQVLLGAYGISYGWQRPTPEGREKALDEVSFEISRGEFVALLGPNGSGKSTLMKVVSGILPMQKRRCSGQVRYLNQDFLSLPSTHRARKVVYVAPDLRAEFPMTVQEVVSLGRTCQAQGLIPRNSEQDQIAIRWAMEQCLCWNLRDRALESLSGGERQLVALARGLAQGAKILFLDEALSRMDLNHQIFMGKMLKELTQKGWSILLVSHDVNLASEWADSGIFLKGGKKVFQGAICDILTQERIKQLYPESDLVVGRSPVTGVPKVFFGTQK